MDQKFFVVKDNETKEIKYFDYEKINGYNLVAKPDAHFQDAVDISRMIIIKPSFAEKLVTKKINLKFEQFMNIVAAVCEEEDESGESYRIVLNEAEKLRQEIINKYKKYLTEDRFNLMLKKIEILEDELKLRAQIVMESFERQNQMTNSRGR